MEPVGGNTTLERAKVLNALTSLGGEPHRGRSPDNLRSGKDRYRENQLLTFCTKSECS